MNVTLRPQLTGARLFLVATTFVLATTAVAQDSASGTTIDPDVFRLFLETRTNKPAAQATAEDREGVTNELRDIYLVTNQPAVVALAKNPDTKAQLELQRRAILFNAFAVDFLSKNPATDQEIFNFYQDKVAAAPPPEFKARHILVESQAQALSLVTELDGGADFEALAKEHSTGPSGPGGGDLGWFEARQMVPEFSAALVELEDGAYSKAPVQTQFGWHVILREDSRDGTPPPLESVRDVIKQQVDQEKFTNHIDKLRAAANE